MRYCSFARRWPTSVYVIALVYRYFYRCRYWPKGDEEYLLLFVREKMANECLYLNFSLLALLSLFLLAKKGDEDH